MTDTCSRGHPRTEENIYVDPKGLKRCRICRRKNQANFWAKNNQVEYKRQHQNGRRVSSNQMQLFSTEPLHARIRRFVTVDDLTHDQLAVKLGVTRDLIRKILGTEAVSATTADKWACCLRAHPSELWPEWEAA